MKEIYLEIDGKRIKLSKEQVKLLNLDKQENKNPFTKVALNDKYYLVNHTGTIENWRLENNGLDRSLYNAANMFNDKEFAIRQAKSEVLNRLLKRFSYENGWSDDLWEDNNIYKYCIVYEVIGNKYEVLPTIHYKRLSTVYFISEDIAKRAIDEIIIPFEQGKLEVCKIWE